MVFHVFVLFNALHLCLWLASFRRTFAAMTSLYLGEPKNPPCVCQYPLSFVVAP